MQSLTRVRYILYQNILLVTKQIRCRTLCIGCYCTWSRTEEVHTNTQTGIHTNKFRYVYRLIYNVQTVKRYKETECLLLLEKNLGPGTEKPRALLILSLQPWSSSILTLLRASWHTMMLIRCVSCCPSLFGKVWQRLSLGASSQQKGWNLCFGSRFALGYLNILCVYFSIVLCRAQNAF